MACKLKAHHRATLKVTSNEPYTPRKTATPPKSNPVALTVKVDDETYVRLCTLGATQRRTNQDILREALDDYLERVAK
jgi:hypothetical protein